MNESARGYNKNGLLTEENAKHSKLLAKCESLKRMAVVSITFSTFAAFICIISIPFVYNYLQRVQSLLQIETDFCKVFNNNKFY